MPRFIPIDKMKKLREAAKVGDERAKKILSMQLGGTEDFSPLIDEYFSAPQPVLAEQPTGAMPEEHHEHSKLEQFLHDNSITKESPDYKAFVEDFYKENPNEPRECEECECVELLKKLIGEESDAIDSYSKAITSFMNSVEVEDIQKRRIISRLKEIRSDEEEHFRELGELLKICENKEEIKEGIE